MVQSVSVLGWYYFLKVLEQNFFLVFKQLKAVQLSFRDTLQRLISVHYYSNKGTMTYGENKCHVFIDLKDLVLRLINLTTA